MKLSGPELLILAGLVRNGQPQEAAQVLRTLLLPWDGWPVAPPAVVAALTARRTEDPTP